MLTLPAVLPPPRPPEITGISALTWPGEISGAISREYRGGMDLPERADGSWTLLTGHGHVLVEIARNTRARIGDIAAAAGLTERTVQAIIADLEAAGYITRTRAGRRTVYTVHPDRPFRHPAQDGHRIGPFLELLAASGDRAGDAARPRNPPAGP
jgi:MarR family